MLFEIEFEVPFADVDQHGVMHHPKYLQYLEQARLKFLLQNGLDYREWIAAGYMLPVADLHIRYYRPLRMGDRFQVSIVSARIEGRRSIVLDYQVLKAGQRICQAEVKLICVRTQDHQVAIIPDLWRQSLEKTIGA